MINKKGQGAYGIFIVVGLIIGLLLLSFVFSLGGVVVKEATDVIIPEFSNLGIEEPVYNISEGAQLALGPVQAIIDNFSLMTAVVFMLGIIGVFAVAFAFRGDVSAWNMALFFAIALGTIFLCVMISNSYEELYTGSGNIAVGLQEAGLISWLILRSPTILTIVTFIAGIILFSGSPQEGGF